MKITISGDIGSGKSTVGEKLAKSYGVEYLDCGQLYRQYSEQIGKNVLSQNESKDTSIDKMIDDKLAKMETMKSHNAVVVSRTAWHFIPSAIHVYISVDPLLAAQRILERKSRAEQHVSLNEVLSANSKRIYLEDRRYESLYGISRKEQLEKADIIICIGNRTSEEVTCALRATIDNFVTGNKVLLFDPKVAAPTQVLRDIDMETVQYYRNRICDFIINPKMELSHRVPYIIDGHHRIIAACASNVGFVKCTDFAITDIPTYPLSRSDYYDWEDCTKGDLQMVTDKTVEMNWCMDNKPDACTSMSADELLDIMHDEFLRTFY